MKKFSIKYVVKNEPSHLKLSCLMLLVVLYLVKNSQSAVDISECVVLEEGFDEYRYDPGDVQHVQESHRHDHRSRETLQVLTFPASPKYKTGM